MKKIVVLLLAAAYLAGNAVAAQAIDFRIRGDWMFGFGLVDTNYVKKVGNKKVATTDDFASLQRVRLQMDAVASEAVAACPPSVLLAANAQLAHLQPNDASISASVHYFHLL